MLLVPGNLISRLKNPWLKLLIVYTTRRGTGSESLPVNWAIELSKTMRVFPDFITPREEESLFKEVEPYMKRLRYESAHWDDVR